MVDWRLDEVLAGLRDGRLLGDAAFAGHDLPALLAERQQQGYLGNYSGASDELSHRWRLLPVHPDHRGLFEAIRSAAYDTAHAALGRHQPDEDLTCELSTLVMQEFEFIAQSRAVLWEHPWVDGLWEAYRAGGLPAGPWPFVPEGWRELGRTRRCS